MENITESNRLIAEFIGTFYDNDRGGIYEFDIDIEDQRVFKPHELKFYSSWDWLMPVVEKIEPLVFGFDINKSGCIIHRFKENGTLPYFKCSVNHPEKITKLEATYKAVVEFIKWYNLSKITN